MRRHLQSSYYDLSLPTNYATSPAPFPVLVMLSPSGGGMVDHFRTVAEEKKWILIGISQSKNGQESLARTHFIRAIFEQALGNLKIDPNRIFAGGFSGGGLGSFGVAMGNAPLVAGVFSMGGWLGNNYNRQRDMYLPGILVARANGNSDAVANSYLSSDAAYLSSYLESGDLKDWSFTGSHVAAASSPRWQPARAVPGSGCRTAGVDSSLIPMAAPGSPLVPGE